MITNTSLPNYGANVFSKRLRVFIETVAGCGNLNCTSPCKALGQNMTLMDEKQCLELYTYFSQHDFLVHLYGQGDGGLLTNQNANMPGAVAIVTPRSYHRIPQLRGVGATLFARIDRTADLKTIMPSVHLIDGAFAVINDTNADALFQVGHHALVNNLPFMFRSLCGTPLSVPSVETVMANMFSYGHTANKVIDVGCPSKGCEVPTVRIGAQGYGLRACILHDEESWHTTLDGLLGEIKSWAAWKEPKDHCLQCQAENGEDYRIYFEPE